MNPTDPNAFPEPFAAAVLCGGSPAVRQLRLQIERIAPHFRAVLLLGERATGKRTIARELHRRSLSATPESFRMVHAFELAARSAATGLTELRELFAESRRDPRLPGTICIAGVDALLPEVQAALFAHLERLLRQAHGSEMRVVLTAEAVRGAIELRRLWPELRGRAGVLQMQVPALRDRLEDMPAMRVALGGHPAALGGESSEVRGNDHRIAWPGNLRELWEAVSGHPDRQAAAATERHRLPSAPAPAPVANGLGRDEDQRIETIVGRHVQQVLRRCAGNKLRAAELLGISRSTLYRMLDSSAGALR